MTRFDDVIDDLRRVLARSEDLARPAVGFRFGARVLAVHVDAVDDPILPYGALPAADVAQAGVHVHLVDAVGAAAIRFDPDARLAPYGALIDSVGSGWLVVRSPDTGAILALDVERRVALYHPGSRVAPRERAEFLRPLLHWLAILDGGVVVHAGGVAFDGRGVLVAGAGNAGKSTLVRACLAAGFATLGDNVVEVTRAAEGTRLVSTYATFKTRPAPVIPVDAAWPADEWDDEARKHIHFAADVLGEAFAADGAVHVATLVLDESAGPRIDPLARAAAMFRVAPNTVAQFPFFERETLVRTGEVLAAAPLFTAGRLPVSEIAELVRGLTATEGVASGGR